MRGPNLRDRIIDLLINKAALKQDVATLSENVLGMFKTSVEKELKAFRKELDDERIRLKFEDKSSHEFIVYIGSDVLVFQLHRNIFRLDDENPLWETEYLKSNGANGYFGIINIYNFLAESFEKNRYNDAGYLIGRAFINHDEKCMVEGKCEFGAPANSLEKNVIDTKLVKKIIQNAMAFSVEFDLVTPPYDLVQEVSVMQILEISSNLQIATGKRLGFKFSNEDETIF